MQVSTIVLVCLCAGTHAAQCPIVDTTRGGGSQCPQRARGSMDPHHGDNFCQCACVDKATPQFAQGTLVVSVFTKKTPKDIQKGTHVVAGNMTSQGALVLTGDSVDSEGNAEYFRNIVVDVAANTYGSVPADSIVSYCGGDGPGCGEKCELPRVGIASILYLVLLLLVQVGLLVWSCLYPHAIVIAVWAWLCDLFVCFGASLLCVMYKPLRCMVGSSLMCNGDHGGSALIVELLSPLFLVQGQVLIAVVWNAPLWAAKKYNNARCFILVVFLSSTFWALVALYLVTKPAFRTLLLPSPLELGVLQWNIDFFGDLVVFWIKPRYQYFHGFLHGFKSGPNHRKLASSFNSAFVRFLVKPIPDVIVEELYKEWNDGKKYTPFDHTLDGQSSGEDSPRSNVLKA